MSAKSPVRTPRPALSALALLASALGAAHADGTPFLEREAVRDWASALADERGLQRDRIAELLTGLEPDARVLELISAPAERTLTWKEYAPIFLTDERIGAGRAWMDEHGAALAAAEREHGVPVPVIAAIVGVETFYGRIAGNRAVLRSLATLGFDYPPRADFFRRELGEFLVLAEAQGWDAAAVNGSYAGAMGLPQFIPSSYRAYAVDGDGDGKIDLFDSVPDVASSVGNYLARHGWRAGATIAEDWEGAPASAADLVRESLKPAIDAATVRAAGFDSAALERADADDDTVSVMRFAAREAGAGDRTVVGYNNFYAITRYNHSRLYAMAVTELARALGDP